MSKNRKNLSVFINKTEDGRNNACGQNVYLLRKKLNLSQRALADKLQLMGLDVNKNAIQRIESGQRFVTDIELLFLKEALNVQFEELFG